MLEEAPSEVIPNGPLLALLGRGLSSHRLQHLVWSGHFHPLTLIFGSRPGVGSEKCAARGVFLSLHVH
jgi:hypothetical protein